MPFRERIEWCDVWVTDADSADRRRVLLIGDSITRSYFGPVEEIVKARYSCARVTSSRSVCDPNFMRELDLVLQEYRFSLIQLNNGLHGWDYTEAAYAESLGQCMDLLSERALSSRLVWANSTPVWARGESGVLAPNTARVRERNRLALELASRRQIPVVDLFAALVEHPEHFGQDGVHLTAGGQRLAAGIVADGILKLAR